ncbi:hypothetical protein MNBD_GAMMA11-875 [hydrothermal vent metagenome]|uniref:DUF1499 domain-containing protein n=1 Tax=hydrothermal vent metagenome TaxID=652676 RepID=A0A3B0XPY4_9ZZZZ
MKFLLITLLFFLIGISAYFFYLGYKSQKGNPPGLHSARLSPCPDKSNCICTEYPNDPSHFTDALQYDEKSADAIVQSIRATIKETGGQLINADNINRNSTYISAIYTSSLFKFIDDFEVRIDPQNKRIHIRSASRVGHSDMGENLKRIAAFKKIYPTD